MKRTKLESYLGFATKARKLVSGTSSCMFEMQKGKVKLLIIASDIAEGSKEKIIAEAKRQCVEYRVYGQSEELSHITGTQGRSTFAIKDQNFAKCILDEIDK